jgi:DNA repair exonuclease SbcCD ATPase subunit
MIIKKMRASFGTLQGSELELHDGLNVIYAPNESGKSTWCAFIRAMLYGIDSSERAKAGFKPDKTRYAPWSGKPMSGEMEIEYAGQEITLARMTKTASAPMREFKATYTGTGEVVPGLSGSDAGETIVGAPKAVFERSAFIKQAGLGVSGSPELEKRITALVATGEESVTYNDADSRLRAWQRARKYNKRGRIPELEDEIFTKQQALRQNRAAASGFDSITEELSRAEEQLPALRAAVTESRKNARRAALDRLSENKNRLRELERSVAAAENACAECQRELDELPFADGAEPEKVSRQAREDADFARHLLAESGKTLPAAAYIAPLVLAVILVCLGFALALPLVFVGVVFAAGGVAVLVISRKRKVAAGEAADKRLEILLRYSASDEDGIIAAAERYDTACARKIEADAALAAAQREYSAVSQSQAGLDAQILSDLDFSGGDNGAAEQSRRLSQAEARVAALREQRAKAEGELSAMGDPLVLESELGSLEENRARLEAEYAALELAQKTLAEANTEIQTRFSPKLGSLAGELMQKLTDGRYEALSVDKSLEPSVRLQGDAEMREGAFLSTGAQDQMYLALRLAICQLVLPQEEPCPIILDDALASFDDERMARAMELLREISSTRQVILFSCHTREKEYIER